MAETIHLTVHEQSNPVNMSVDPAIIIPAISPTAYVTQTEDGAVLTVTDKNGTTQAEIHNGEQGEQGEPGTPGQPGQPGVSPTISVTDITGGHRVTITDATGDHSFDVMNGSDADAPVQDVQVNGTSILQNGVANVPIANPTTPGVVYEAPFRQIKQITITEDTGEIIINRDEDGKEFELSEIVVYIESALATGIGNGAITVNGMNNKFCSMTNMYHSSIAQTRSAHITIRGGRVFGETSGSTYQNSYNPINLSISQYMTGIQECGLITSIRLLSLNGYLLKSGKITIYGR